MITIREAEQRDLEALQTIGRATYREHFASIWSAEGMQRFLDQDFAPQALEQSLAARHQHLWLLALDAQQVPIGFAKLNWNRPVPGSGKVGAELQKIYLLKSQAGQNALGTVVGRREWFRATSLVTLRGASEYIPH